MPTRDEQIGQGAGDEQAMGVLCEPAIAYLGEGEHPLNDPDRMLLYTAISCTVFRGKVNLTAEHHKNREETSSWTTDYRHSCSRRGSAVKPHVWGSAGRQRLGADAGSQSTAESKR
jgi:hypothetical protein